MLLTAIFFLSLACLLSETQMQMRMELQFETQHRKTAHNFSTFSMQSKSNFQHTVCNQNSSHSNYRCRDLLVPELQRRHCTTRKIISNHFSFSNANGFIIIMTNEKKSIIIILRVECKQGKKCISSSHSDSDSI